MNMWSIIWQLYWIYIIFRLNMVCIAFITWAQNEGQRSSHAFWSSKIWWILSLEFMLDNWTPFFVVNSDPSYPSWLLKERKSIPWRRSYCHQISTGKVILLFLILCYLIDMSVLRNTKDVEDWRKQLHSIDIMFKNSWNKEHVLRFLSFCFAKGLQSQQPFS